MRQYLPAYKNLGPLTLHRLKLLPALIVFAVLLILVKFDRIYQASQLIFLNPAKAEKTEDPTAAAQPTKVDMPKVESEPVKAKQDNAESTASIAPYEDFNVLNLTPGKIEVLRTLSKRHKELVERESTIAEREATLQAIEKRLELKMANLDKIQEYLETLLQQKQDKEIESTKRLVVVYEKMKPAVAANILQGIDLETLLNIMEQMKESKASEILSKMEPLRARILTMELAQRRKKQEEEIQEQYADQANHELNKTAGPETSSSQSAEASEPGPADQVNQPKKAA